MKKITIEEIKEVVDSYYGIDINTGSRSNEESHARFVYYALCVKLTNDTLVNIGKSVNKAHCTVINGLNKFNGETLQKKYYNDYSNIISILLEENKIDTSVNFFDYMKYKKELQDILSSNKEINKSLFEEYVKMRKMNQSETFKKITEHLSKLDIITLEELLKTRIEPYLKMKKISIT